ncbi:MAG: ATPase, partial [Leptolyngbyaceae cyanobacterium]
MTASRTICLGFLALIIIGTILLLLPWSVAAGTWNSPLTALFTATSAVCVTGLIVVDTGSY